MQPTLVPTLCVSTLVPTLCVREYHLREILRLPEETRKLAWTEIVEKAGTPEDVKIADAKIRQTRLKRHNIWLC